MTVINTNIAANVAANAMKSNASAMEQTMERLATGMRINSAGDDAAGLAIGARMEAQINGLGQATRNANDAISMIQTVDGAASEIGDMLQRMRELAVQANNGTNETSDIANLNKEFIQLATEIDRIAEDTKFNGTNLMSSGATKSFTIGSDEADVVTVDFQDFNLAAGGQTAAGESRGSTDIDVTNAALLIDLGTAGDITFSDGTTVITTNLAEINVANGVTSITAANATQTQIAAGLDASAVASSAFTGRFSATGDANLIITEKVGSGGADDVYTVGGITAASSVTMSGGSAGTLSGVLGANLSSYSDTNVTIDDTGVIAALDTAIVNVAAARADYGSVINRLEHTIDNLNSSVLNTTSAKSSIMDADYAAETTELARTQIIAQASTAMLSQANQQQQSILALLK